MIVYERYTYLSGSFSQLGAQQNLPFRICSASKFSKLCDKSLCPIASATVCVLETASFNCFAAWVQCGNPDGNKKNIQKDSTGGVVVQAVDDYRYE